MKPARCSPTAFSSLILTREGEGRRHLRKCLLSWIYGESESKKVDVRTRVACRFPPSFSPLARGIIAFPHFSKRRFEMCFWNRNEIHPDQKQQPPPRDTLNGIVPRCSFLIYGSFSPVFGLLAILIPPCAALASFTYRNTDRVTAIGCEILHHQMQKTQNFTLAPFPPRQNRRFSTVFNF